MALLRRASPVTLAGARHARRARSGGGGQSQLVRACLAAGLLYAAYFVLRYGGLWTENDTAEFTRFAVATTHLKTVLSATQYTHGFGYTGWLTAIALVSGVSLPVLNTIILPFVGATLLLLPAYLAYRTLLGSARAGLLAAALLLAVPDMFFSVLRGNHEKLNIAIVLVAIYVLFRGFENMGSGSAFRLTVWVLLFYILMAVNAMVNDYFASTFVTAATLTLLLGTALSRFNGGVALHRPAMLRFTITVAVSWLLMWWVVLFVFPPAGEDFKLISSAQQKVATLFLTLQASSNPYSIAAQEWSSTAVSLFVASFRWILVIGSLVTWIIKLWGLLTGARQYSLERLFLLALYGSFGFLVLVAIPVDLVGLYAGSNLEVRNFAYFALFSAPMFAWGLRDAYVVLAGVRRGSPTSASDRRRWEARSAMLKSATAVTLAVFVLIGLLKVVVDPLVANQWIMYSPAEKEALLFFVPHSRGAGIWLGPDSRLFNTVSTWSPLTGGSGAGSNRMYDGIPAPQARVWLASPQITADVLAYGSVLPPYSQQNRIYDNGDVQLYRVAPRTQFQN